MGFILHGDCISLTHGHSHGNSVTHGHSHSLTSSTAENNINVRAAVIHVLGDLIQSVGVLCAALIIKFYVSYTMYLIYKHIYLFIRSLLESFSSG